MTDYFSRMKALPTFSTESFYCQCFPFPADVIKFLLNNISSPDLYQKLIQTCKYFYSKKRVIVYKYGARYDVHIGEWIVYPFLESCNYQLWLKNNLYCETYDLSQNVSQLLVKVYKCHLNILHLKRQQLSYEEYLLLASSKTVRNFSMTYITICHKDGSYVPFEKLMEQIPNAFYCKL